MEGSTLAQAAEATGRSIESCRHKARDHGVKIRAPGEWTEEEEELLRELCPKFGREATARKLGRSVGSVRNKVTRMGLTFESEARITLKQVAEELGVAVSTVRRRAKNLSIGFRRYKGRTNKHRYGSNPVGANPWEIVRLAQDMLDNPPSGRSNASVKNLRRVIEKYSYGFDGARVTKLNADHLTNWMLETNQFGSDESRIRKVADQVIDQLVYGEPVPDLLAKYCHYEFNYLHSKTGLRTPAPEQRDFVQLFKLLDCPKRSLPSNQKFG